MIALDWETTGLLKPDACELHLQPFGIQFYACKFNESGKIIKEIDTYLKPPVPIPQIITDITGITNHDVRNAPKFIEIYDDLVDLFLGERTVFAHNCSFDMGILNVELLRHDLETRFPWPVNQVCTVEASYPINNKRMKLGQLYQLATGKTYIEKAHTAKADTKALVDCVLWLKKEGFINEAAC